MPFRDVTPAALNPATTGAISAALAFALACRRAKEAPQSLLSGPLPSFLPRDFAATIADFVREFLSDRVISLAGLASVGKPRAERVEASRATLKTETAVRHVQEPEDVAVGLLDAYGGQGR